MARTLRKRQWAERALTKQQKSSLSSLRNIETSQVDALPSHKETNNNQLIQHNIQGRSATLASLLGGFKDVKDGMLMHHYIVHKGLESSLFLGSHLLHMYLRCKSQEDGLALSASMCDQNVYSWNHLIQACSDQSEGLKPLKLFNRMQEEAVLPNRITFLGILTACAGQPMRVDVERIHARIACSDYAQDTVLGTALLKMYGQCGQIKDASRVFDNMPGRDVVIWTTIITLFAEQGQSKEALRLFYQMQEEGVRPSKITFLGILAVCAKHAALGEGEEMHTCILVDGLESDVTVGNALVNMYGKCGNLDDARTVFDKMPEKNVVTWTSMITLYTQKGYGKAALLLFDQMQSESIIPNQVTFVSIIVACACRAVLDEGKRMHARILDIDSRSDAVVGAALVNMYDKCGSLVDARRVFDTISKRDLVLWNTMIAAYAQNCKSKEAIELFESMQAKGLCPDKITFSNIFAVCADCAHQAEGDRMHAYIMESGLELELIVGNALVHMYAQCDDLDHARSIFDNLLDRDVVSWTVMIAAYALHGQCKKSLRFFDQMQQEGILPDKVTYVSVLDACGSYSANADYRQIYARVVKSGFDSDVGIQNAIINLCGKWGSLQDAEGIFDMLPERDVVSWNAMITVYSHRGKAAQALEVFDRMLSQEVTPDKVTFVSVLSACASQTLLAEGKHIHTWAVDSGCDVDIVLGTAVLTMYGKCGSLEDARRCFDNMQERNVLTWNAMMAVYAQHGQGKEAVQLFLKMQEEKMLPDTVSFLAVLVACSHAGLAEEGRKFFTSMVQERGMLPTADHYACMIDLLGRAGRLEEAENLMYGMPSQPTNAPFKTVLGACKSKADVERVELVAKYAFELESDNSTYYVILSNIYSALGKDVNTSKLLTNMKGSCKSLIAAQL